MGISPCEDQEKYDLTVTLRKKLHDNPEASMKEVKTRQILMDFIKDHTETVEVVDRGSWFYALKRGKQGNPPIAFRADFDAVTCADGLPRHLCGHDGHSAVLAGFSLWLDQCETDRDVYLLFQPGEESGEGAVITSSLITEKNIGEIYGFHNIPGYECGRVILIRDSFACASTGLEITINGKQSHAAYPENGVNPSGVIVGILEGMDGYLKEEHRGIVLGTVIGIEAGSRSYGVSAGEGTLRLTVRAQYQDEYDRFIEYIEKTAKELAGLAGASLRITRIEEFPATVNHKNCVEKIRMAAEKLGHGTEYRDEPFRWSEDFGYYLQKTRGAFMGIGCGKDHPGLHTAAYEFEDGIIMTAINLYRKIAGIV